MSKEEQVLGIIPARGGSKGIPDKNIYLVNEKPLISYTINAALQSRCLTKTILSTDSKKIAEIALNYKIAVPFIRPAEYATDSALAIDVIKHALLEMERQDEITYDYVVMLQPTSPLKLASDIDDVIDKLIETQCDTVISMVDVGANHPVRMYEIKDDQLVSVMDEEITMRPRQELRPVFIRNGSVYACRRNVIFDYNTLVGPDCRPVIMPKERSVNIDELEDIYLAEYYLNNQI